jgi:arsenic resistance protein ArsH
MRPSSFYDRVVGVMEEVVRFTVLRPHVAQFTDRYSERKEDAAKAELRLLAVTR